MAQFFRFVFLAISFLCILGLSPSILAQNQFGYEAYDSVEIDLKNGAIMSRYLPFDVPFKLHGDADGLSSVKVRIVESDQAGCCGKDDDCADSENYFLDCDCPYISVRQQRLAFFRRVRSIMQKYSWNKNKKAKYDTSYFGLSARNDTIAVDIIADYLYQLPYINKRSIRKYYKEQIKNKTNNQVEDTKNIYQYFKPQFTAQDDSVVKKLVEFLNDPVSLKKKDTRKSVVSYFYSSRLIKEEIRRRIKVYADSLRVINEDTTNKKIVRGEYVINSTSIDKYLADTSKNDTSLRRHMARELTSTHLYTFDTARIRKSMFERSIKHLKRDLKFVEKHEKRWSKFVGKVAAYIKEDSLRTCVSCDINQFNCNYVGQWKRDTLGRSEFQMIIPPLDANTSYRFFFEIEREATNTERGLAKYVASKSLAFSLDSVVSMPYRQLRNPIMNNDIRYIRDTLITGRLGNVQIKLMQQNIKTYLSDHYNQTIDVNTRNLNFDTLQIKSLTNHFISHQYYKEELDSLILRNATTTFYTDILSMPILRNLDDYYRNFFKEDQLEAFYLLDSLHILSNNEVLTKLRPNRDVPSGLRTYDNLQKVTLRNLQEINDLNPTTVLAYERNLNDYLAYLKKLQSFINDQLIKNKGNLRRKLFSPSSLGSSTTQRSRERTDLRIITSLHNISRTLYGHQNDVQATLNFYKNYRENVIQINETIKNILDSALNLNNRIQLSANREAGGLVSADFQTRTEWYVSADLGVAYTGLGDFENQVLPYAGVNFNFAPINRQAHYSLLRINKKKRLRYLPPLCDERIHIRNFWTRWKKASSLVLGLTLTDFTTNISDLESITANAESLRLNILTGYGVRITDAARYSAGILWLKQNDPNDNLDRTVVKPFFYQSLSFDIDVAGALGAVGRALFPGKTAPAPTSSTGENGSN